VGRPKRLWDVDQRELLRAIAPKVKDFTTRRAYRNTPLSDADRKTNWRKSSVRSKVAHPFLMFKRLWGFAMLATINLVSPRSTPKHQRRLGRELQGGVLVRHLQMWL
jgi:hypothetical protein